LTGVGATAERRNRNRAETWSTPAKKLLAVLVLLTVGAGSGALVGAANAGHPRQNVTNDETTRYELALESPPPFMAAGLVVEEAAPPALTKAAPVVMVVKKRIVRSRAEKAARSAAPVNMPLISGSTVVCDRLDDAKINWLLGLVAKTRGSHPELGGVATKVDQQLRAAMGRNMCAAEAQAHVAAMCQDPAVVNFMKQMVRELPFFIRPMVGDPCKTDLVAAANRWLN
jgi:hypothetical protein